MSKYGVISDTYLPVFSPNTGKCRPEITSYLDNFHVVLYSYWISFSWNIKVGGVNKFCVYVNNLTRSIINAKYTIFMHTLCIFYKQFNLFDSLSKSLYNQGSQFLLVDNDFSLDKLFFFFFSIFFISLLLVVLVSIFFCFGLISFFQGLFTFFWFYCNFLLEGKIIMISDFSKCWFVGLTNLGTFK